jgi:hypothetical protein
MAGKQVDCHSMLSATRVTRHRLQAEENNSADIEFTKTLAYMPTATGTRLSGKLSRNFCVFCLYLPMC